MCNLFGGVYDPLLGQGHDTKHQPHFQGSLSGLIHSLAFLGSKRCIIHIAAFNSCRVLLHYFKTSHHAAQLAHLSLYAAAFIKTLFCPCNSPTF